MKAIEEQLRELPQEFIVEMEHQKSERWKDVYKFICSYFECENDIEEAEEQGFPMKDFLKKIHDFGFYGGVNFALDPQEEYVRK